jgi:chloramphenicol O-acetyltransferase type A
VRYIDLETWDRKEYFDVYLGRDFPYINIGAEVDITGLISFCNSQGLSSYLTMIHTAHRAALANHNFRYRIVERRPAFCDEMLLTFTHIPKGGDLFVNVLVDFDEDLERFHDAVRAEIARQGTDPGFAALRGRNDVIYYTAVPWVRYTHFVRTIASLGWDSNPKISWGKYSEREGRTLVPFSTQTHHGLMDGLHVGRYFEELQRLLDGF